MKNLKNIILKIVFAGITLFSINSVKALKVVNENAYQDERKQAVSYEKWFPCGGIAILKADQKQNGGTLFERSTAVEALVQTRLKEKADLWNSRVLAEIAGHLGLNLHFLGIPQNQIVLANLAGQRENAVRTLISHFKFNQQSQHGQRQIHFVCGFLTKAGDLESGHYFLITIDRTADTMYVQTDDYTKTPNAQKFVTDLNTIYETATLEMAQESLLQEGGDFYDDVDLDEFAGAIAASMAPQPLHDDNAEVLKASIRSEEERLAQQAQQEALEIQQLEETLRASQQPAPQTQVTTLTTDQMVLLNVIDETVLVPFIAAQPEGDIVVTVGALITELERQNKLNYLEMLGL